MSGKVYSISTNQDDYNVLWENKVSPFAVYADLTTYKGDLYVASSDFYLHNINADNGKVNWKTSTFERITDNDGSSVLGDLVGQPDYQSSAIVADGVAYFGSPRFVYAVEIESGKELWRFETKGQVTGSPAYANGRIFFGQRGGTPMFYCLNSTTGNPLWKKKFGWVWASAHAKDDKVYISSENGTFRSVSQEDGSVLWKQETNAYSYPVPSFYKNLVFFGSGNKYYAYESNSGKQIWQFDMGQGRADSGTSMVKNGIIYLQGAASTHFFALDALSGKEIWRYPIKEINASPASDGEYVIVSSWEGLLIRSPNNAFTYSFDATIGEINYRLNFGGLSGAVISNDIVFSASSNDPYFKAWDLATGKVRWKYKMGGRAEESCTTIYGDKAFIVVSDGYLYAFN